MSQLAWFSSRWVVEQIFTWRTAHKLGRPTIAARLNADPGRYPAPRPGSGWTTQTVFAVLGNPKYTGHMVYGRVRTRNGRRVAVPADQWLWSPQPAHPAIIDRDTWDAAQHIGTEHGTSRDGHGLAAHPAAVRTYAYRGRVRCRDCRRRMAGLAYGPGPTVYYQCPHNPARPKEAADYPGHPRTVKLPRSGWTRSWPCSWPSTSSDPAAPNCSPPSCPPPTPTPPPNGTPS